MADLLSSPSQEQSAPLFHPWRELTILATLAMDLCWVALWYTTFSLIGGIRVTPLLPYVVFGLQMTVAHYLARGMAAFGIQKRIRRLIFCGAILVCFWITFQTLLYSPELLSLGEIGRRIVSGFADTERIPAEFWVMLSVLLVWARGVALARRSAGVDVPQASFQLGILLIFTFAAFRSFQAFVPDQQAFGLIFWFFFFGLFAMGAGRIYEAGRARGGRLTIADRSWLLGVGLSALLVVALGLVPAYLLPPGVADTLVRYLFTLLLFVVGLTIVLFSPIVLVLILVLPYLQQLWRAFARNLGVDGLFQPLAGLNIPQQTENLSAQIATAKPVVMWGILILVFVGVLAGLSIRMWMERNLEPEEKLSLIQPGDLWGLLKKALRKRLADTTGDLRNRIRLRSTGRMMMEARVRWIYARLMALCAHLGDPRLPATTPLEYLPDLHALFPDQQAEATLITETYVRVRYGDIPESVEEIKTLVSAWKTISAAARKMKKTNE